MTGFLVSQTDLVCHPVRVQKRKVYHKKSKLAGIS